LVHGDAAADVVTQMLCYLDNQVVLISIDAGVGDVAGVKDVRQFAGLEFDVDYRSDNLSDFSNFLFAHWGLPLLKV
jgi:hypothetical protein